MTAPGSLAYRKSEAAILAGTVPAKYTRLLPYITGRRILEFGAAEGVLALLLADRDPEADVVAIEANAHRHTTALELQARWRAMGRRVDRCTMLEGNIVDLLHHCANVETVVAIRTIYHLGEHVPHVFDCLYRYGVERVVVGGNPNRARRAREGTGDPFDHYAGVDGMRAVLETAGYHVETVVAQGDPIVTGHR